MKMMRTIGGHVPTGPPAIGASTSVAFEELFGEGEMMVKQMKPKPGENVLLSPTQSSVRRPGWPPPPTTMVAGAWVVGFATSSLPTSTCLRSPS